MDLIDLYYPIETNQSFINDIFDQFMVMRNFEPDYFSSMEKLEAIEGLHFRCANIASRIFQANQTVDRKEFLNEFKQKKV